MLQSKIRRNKLIAFIERIIKGILLFLARHPIYRKLRTFNFRTGLVALGESNHYRVGGEWMTVDLSNADFLLTFDTDSRLPFQDNSVQVIYSSHMIEHISTETLSRLLHECQRILRPGGWIRFEAPDAEKIIAAYKNNDLNFMATVAHNSKEILVNQMGYPAVYGENYMAILGLLSCFISEGKHIAAFASKEDFDAALNKFPRLEDLASWCLALQSAEQQQTHGHISLIYKEKLTKLFLEAKFVDIEYHANRKTNIPGIRLSSIERPHRAFYSLYVEAQKTWNH